MPGVTIYEKLSAVSNKPVLVSDRQTLIEVIAGLGRITIDSDWQDVPTIYSNLTYNEILRTVTDKLKSYNQSVSPSLVIQELDEAKSQLMLAVDTKMVNSMALAKIIQVLADLLTGSVQTKEDARKMIDLSLSQYFSDDELTLRPLISPDGSQADFSVDQCQPEDTLLENIGSGFTEEKFSALKATFEGVKEAIDHQIEAIQMHISEISPLKVAVVNKTKNEICEFDTLKRFVVSQLNEKLAAVSQAIEFYDAVVST